MKLIRGNPKTNCLIGSLAMLLDKPYDELTDDADGWKLIWPSLPSPSCFRGFHVEEIQYTLLRYGICLVPYYPGIAYQPDGSVEPLLLDFDEKLNMVMSYFDGLIIGLDSHDQPHAVAWSHKDKLVYDPRGYTASRESIQIECFFIVGRCPTRIAWSRVPDRPPGSSIVCKEEEQIK